MDNNDPAQPKRAEPGAPDTARRRAVTYLAIGVGLAAVRGTVTSFSRKEGYLRDFCMSPVGVHCPMAPNVGCHRSNLFASGESASVLFSDR